MNRGPRAQALALLLGLLALLALPRPAHGQGDDPAAVASELEAIATLVEQGQHAAARRRLEGLQRLTVAGQPLTLTVEGWQRLLDEEPRALAASLRAAAALLRRPPAALPPDAEARLAQILARAEFQPVEPSLWDRFVRWLWERLARLRGPDLGAGGDLVAWLLAALSALVVVGVLALFLRGLRQNRLSDGEAQLPDGDIPLHASEAQQRASEAANAGDYREAMRLLYLAALLHLDEVGLIRFDRALTNREVLDSVASDGSLRALLAPVVVQFDRVWYGHAPFGVDEFASVRGTLEELRTLRRRS